MKGRHGVVPAMKVALGCRALDDLLSGGVEDGCITLLHGEAGSGKTNFCLQLARNVVRSGRKVIFIDTEGVSLERLRQICGDDFDVVAKNILFSEPYSFEEQEKLIEKAVKMTEGNPEVGLIVIDSITMHYRLTMRDETRREERYGLTRQIATLLRVSRQRREDDRALRADGDQHPSGRPREAPARGGRRPRDLPNHGARLGGLALAAALCVEERFQERAGLGILRGQSVQVALRRLDVVRNPFLGFLEDFGAKESADGGHVPAGRSRAAAVRPRKCSAICWPEPLHREHVQSRPLPLADVPL
ncbi:MAG: hypothetical protein E6K14_04000 [Methanobacteriota archaeon]|nr:MAG: hypothetical protein E6K14_04000 [Euryarchaeota archaeon]